MGKSALLLFVLVPAALFAACDEVPAPEPAPTITPHASVTPNNATPTAEPRVQVTGLFYEPRDTVIDATRALGPRVSSFEAWDGESTVIYDTRTGEQIGLGRGSLAEFSPDSTKAAWVAFAPERFEGEARMIDLSSGERRSFGPARGTGFVDDTHIYVTAPGENSTTIIDLVTGDTEASGESIPTADRFDLTTTPDGYELRQQYSSQNPFPESRWFLTDPTTGELLLEFSAYDVDPAGSGHLAVATLERGSLNVFLVDIATGAATIIATSTWSPPNWPMIANERYVAWTDEFCDADAGHTRIFDRADSTITEIDASLWLVDFTPEGLIGAGAFGPDALIDPETLEYVSVIPDAAPEATQQGGGDKTWSPDYRYASHGFAGGHGGYCS